tara:strand:- start:8 stop:349 length:342 start_codon:yes stop_codon:yes gene_type:complete
MSNLNFKNVQTIIAPDVEILGDIKMNGGIIIYGSIKGDVITDGPIRVAKNGKVVGHLRGGDILVGGAVTGDIESSGQVFLGKNCRLDGNIQYFKLHIEDGAVFTGRCDLTNLK